MKALTQGGLSVLCYALAAASSDRTGIKLPLIVAGEGEAHGTFRHRGRESTKLIHGALRRGEGAAQGWASHPLLFSAGLDPT